MNDDDRSGMAIVYGCAAVAFLAVLTVVAIVIATRTPTP